MTYKICGEIFLFNADIAAKGVAELKAAGWTVHPIPKEVPNQPEEFFEISRDCDAREFEDKVMKIIGGYHNGDVVDFGIMLNETFELMLKKKIERPSALPPPRRTLSPIKTASLCSC